MTTVTACARTPIRVHLTNVSGAGAVQLVKCLLPALESDFSVFVEKLHLPDRGPLSSYQALDQRTVSQVYARRWPKVISRLIECTLFAFHFNGDTPLLVLGDLPLRCRGRQVLFVQTSHLVSGKVGWRFGGWRYLVSRTVFRLNLAQIQSFIVQTEVMRKALENAYPEVYGRVHVISQPVPSWLLESGLRRHGRVSIHAKRQLSLIYPAAGYPHKNHALLARVEPQANWPVEGLTVTLSQEANPAPRLSWLRCSGFLSSDQMIEAYSQVDALLFLSKEESYGFPLVEAMFVGLPIVCPDLPYAHTLCGEQAIYFDPDSPDSLCQAMNALKSKLDGGWWPDWKNQLKDIPRDWQTVARKMIEVVVS